MKRLLLAFAPVAMLAACATGAKFQEKMNGFIGSSESALLMAYGPPNSSQTLPDGGKIIRYVRSGQAVIPGVTTYQPVTTISSGTASAYSGVRSAYGNYNGTSTTYVPQTGAPIVINQSCAVNFKISPLGVITEWASEGNHCVAN